MNVPVHEQEVIDMLAAFVDESDPDTKEAQEAHAFQTAERCRELFPDEGTYLSRCTARVPGSTVPCFLSTNP